MKITLLGKEYDFVYNWGSVYTYEKITDEPLTIERTYSRHVLLYSILLFNNAESFGMDFNEFVAMLEDYSIVTRLTEALVAELERKGMYKASGQGSKDDKKKE